MKNLQKELIEFLEKSPSMFHAIDSIRYILEQYGYRFYPEETSWDIQPGTKGYTIRNGSSLIAFHVPMDTVDVHFQISAAHSDSPTYKIKDVSELEGPYEYLRLDTEGYGGMIDMTWLDRPLTAAGRVMVDKGDAMESHLLYIDKDLLMIPSQAIHLNRDVNDGFKFNRQVDTIPLLSAGELKKGDFDKMVAETLGIEPKQIIGKDLYLVNRQKPVVLGWQKEFISAGRLDDLQCVFGTLMGFVQCEAPSSINIYSVFDNEEVGSGTRQGALSTFLRDTLHRISNGLNKSEEDFYAMLAGSFMVSADNAHAVHPNHPEKSDPVNCVFMNKGIVIKENGNQKYATDALSRAVFKKVCKKAEVPVQSYANRSDIPGGSTLGNLSDTQVSIPTVDIGLAQLAMHSSYETAGYKDIEYLAKAMQYFFKLNIIIHGSDQIRIND